MRLLAATLCLFCLAMPLRPAAAQDTVIQTENVRVEYARVLRAEPVYQTLRATSVVQRCEPSTPVAPAEAERSGLSKMVGAVREVLGPAPVPPPGPEAGQGDCRMVPVEREFRRPIAYDVDYVHHGVTYRSRLPQDPGNRLRVRVSITPIVAPAGRR